MDKYVGLDVSDKQTVACVVSPAGKDVYATVPTELPALRAFLARQRGHGDRVHATFEVSGQAGWLYDGLVDVVDRLVVSNPSQMTWIYRTAKKTDRIDARKQAVLLQIDELPAVHMPGRAVRQWRGQIQHRRKLVERACQLKNRIRSYLKGQGIRRPVDAPGWWTQASRRWMEALLDARLERTGAGLLMTIPGVGPRTAEAVLAYTDDVVAFGGASRFVRTLG